MKRVVIIGADGSGKSTLIKAIVATNKIEELQLESDLNTMLKEAQEKAQEEDKHIDLLQEYYKEIEDIPRNREERLHGLKKINNNKNWVLKNKKKSKNYYAMRH